MLQKSPATQTDHKPPADAAAIATFSKVFTDDPDEDLTYEKLIDQEQTRQLYGTRAVAIFTTLINCLTLVVMEWNFIPQNQLLTWVTILLTITVLRALRALHYLYTPPDFQTDTKWLTRFITGVIVSALTWAAVPVFLMPEQAIGQAFIVFIMATMAAAAVTTLSFRLLPVMLFLGITLIPLVVCLLRLDSPAGNSFAVMTLVFLLIMGISSYRLFQINRRHLHAYLHNLQTEKLRKENEIRFQILVENAADAVFLINQTGDILNVNRAACTTLSYSRKELLTKNIRDISTHKSEELISHVPTSLDDTTQVSVQDEYRCADGKRVFVEIRSSTFESAGQQLTLLLARDITQRLQAERQIEKQAFYDILTELPNRRLLLSQLEKELANCKRHLTTGAVFFIDLDQFKTINDALGHPVGDQLLKKIGTTLRNYLRNTDTVARLGGDEFVLVLTFGDKTKEDAAVAAHKLAKKIHTLLSAPFNVDEHELQISPSIGIALFDSNNANVHDLLRQADMAMYHAKDCGRNTYSFFSDELQKTVDERLLLQNLLRLAISNNELSLYYQPQYNINRELVGAEALLRWNQSTHGFISPLKFIPIAENTGLIHPIGDWVLTTACQHVSAWQQQKLPASFRRVSINISPRQFSLGNFSDTMRSVLAETGADPALLELELTESTLLNGVDTLIEEMSKLGKMKIHLAIDDFGTGYSSLSYIKRLPLNRLKIDRFFVKDITVDKEQAALVETIISMAEHMGLGVIAEGVESVEEIEFLKQRNCLEYQGFYFSKPIPHDQFTALLFNAGQKTSADTHQDSIPLHQAAPG